MGTCAVASRVDRKELRKVMMKGNGEAAKWAEQMVVQLVGQTGLPWVAEMVQCWVDCMVAWMAEN